MLRLVFKRNDQETAHGKEMLGMRHGMLVDYHREGEYWPALGKRMKEAFYCVEVEDTKDNLALVRAACQSVEVLLPDGKPDPEKSRARAMRVDVAALGAKLLQPSLDTALRSAVEIAPVKAEKLKLTDVLVSTATLAVASPDVRAVQSGTYDVGPAVGDDYATFVAARADMGNLTGDLTFQQTGDVTEVATSIVTENLNNHKLTFTNTSKPTGDPTTGYVLSINADVIFFDDRQEGPGTTEYDGLYCKVVLNQAAGKYIWHSYVVGTQYTANFRDCMFDGNGKNGYNCLWVDDLQVVLNVWNCKIWDFEDTGIVATAGLIAAGAVWENVTIYGCKRGCIPGGTNVVTVRNCAVYDCSTTCFSSIATSTGYNNSDTDGTAADGNWSTGSGNRTGTAAVDFVSTDDTSADFLDLKSTGALCEVGTTTILAANTSCIRGRDRPNSRTTVSIGASEAIYPVITTPLVPATGGIAGGTSVTISGDDFQSAGATITFGGDAASNDAQTNTELTVTTPAHAAGAVDVIVTNDWGGSTTAAGAFTYTSPTPPPTGDDIEDTLGVTARWVIGFDWSQNPQRKIDLSRVMLDLSTSRITVLDIDDYLAQEVRCRVTGMDAGEVNDLVTFFNARLGRLYKFWVPVITRKFRIVEDAAAMSASLVAVDSGFTEFCQGYERIIIYRSDGTVLVRGIDSATDLGDGTERLNLITPIYSEVVASEVMLCCPMILARFTQDELSLNHVTAHVAEAEVGFRELVKEYTATGGS